jgi:hypothetical protein
VSAAKPRLILQSDSQKDRPTANPAFDYERKWTVEETLQVVHDATQSGAAGVVFGRNIWQSGDTRGMIRALNSIIHEGPPVAEALAESDLA